MLEMARGAAFMHFRWIFYEYIQEKTPPITVGYKVNVNGLFA